MDVHAVWWISAKIEVTTRVPLLTHSEADPGPNLSLCNISVLYRTQPLPHTNHFETRLSTTKLDVYIVNVLLYYQSLSNKPNQPLAAVLNRKLLPSLPRR